MPGSKIAETFFGVLGTLDMIDGENRSDAVIKTLLKPLVKNFGYDNVMRVLKKMSKTGETKALTQDADYKD